MRMTLAGIEKETNELDRWSHSLIARNPHEPAQFFPSGLQFCYHIQPKQPALRENLGFPDLLPLKHLSLAICSFWLSVEW